ncbi:hypothetical protein NFI96_033007, partial [Prochilodus magdalenae]
SRLYLILAAVGDESDDLTEGSQDLQISTMSRIAWYQEKIGAYDQQVWEKSLEQAELKGIRNKPKKTGHIKPDLIDVDLVRGSTFSKAKPVSPWTALTRKGLVRVLLYPFFFKWWIQVTSKWIATGILVLYFLQVAAVALYIDVPAATASEIVGPMCLMLLLGTVHCQIVSTESCRNSDDSPLTSSVMSLTTSRATSPTRRKRQRKARGVKRSDEGVGGITLISWPNKENQRFYKSEKSRLSLRQSVDGLSEDFSSEEEEGEETEGARGRFIPPAQAKPAPGLRKRLPNVTKSSSALSTHQVTTSREADDVMTTVTAAAPLKVENLRRSEESRPASDSDDMLWEELLQDPDSASSASTDSGEEELLCPNHTLPPSTVLTSDEENTFPHDSPWGFEADTIEVKVVEQGMGYLVFGGLVTATLALLPFCFRLVQQLDVSRLSSITMHELAVVAAGQHSTSSCAFFVVTTVERVVLTSLFFFMMCVAERTYKQRFLFAKLFSHITSARKAKKSEIPHFRLKKVQNIKMWLSLRSFLKRRGPQRSVDVIVSSIFFLALSIAFTICAQLLHSHHTFLDWESNWELLVWGAALLIFLLRLATLGAETNHKYSNASVLLTEQINLYLKMEKKPDKKDELSIVNNVLKLATKLLKELDTPFRLLGLTVNPLIYNITRVVILSAVSAVVSDLLGFNIRLWKIKP